MATLTLFARHSMPADAAAARGAEVFCLVPSGLVEHWQARGITHPLHGVDSWYDYTTLARIAYTLPGIDRVVAIEEPCITAAAFLREILGLPGQRLEQATACTDKALMKRRLQSAGIPVARWTVAHSFADVSAMAAEHGWPVVVKPRRGFGTINTHRVDNAAHLMQLHADGAFAAHDWGRDAVALAPAGVLDDLDSAPWGFLVEGWLDVADEFCCDLVLWRGEERTTLNARYLRPLLRNVTGASDVLGAVALPEQHTDARAVHVLTRAACQALQLDTGVVHCEVLKLHNGSFVIGEIACRPGGAFLPDFIELIFGESTVEAFVKISFDEEPRFRLAHPNGPFAVVGLPIRPGRVAHVPTAANFADLPGFLRIDVKVAPGETLLPTIGTTAHAAYLYLQLPDVASATGLVERAHRRLRETLTIEPLVDAVGASHG